MDEENSSMDFTEDSQTPPVNPIANKDAVVNKDAGIYIDGSDLYGQQIRTIPQQKRNIGIDTEKEFMDNVAEAISSNILDIAKIQSFTQVSNNREIIMQLLDTMADDVIIAAALEVYAEDATESNNSGQIVWATSDDPEILKYITYLLDTMNIDKSIYRWVYSLCKYGDVYLRLYRKSEYEDDLFDKKNKEKETLNEDVIIKDYSKDDGYSHYIEMVPNPAEMFELTRFGKSYAYIKANHPVQARQDDMMYTQYYRYSFRKNDVEVYDATNFVHACLEDNSSRTPEEVEIFMTDTEYEHKLGTRYTVRRGQSILYKLYRIWREMNLLENSLLLNRLTKSSILRIFGVEVGDMPKENVRPHLLGIKNMVEQKTAISVGDSMSEYTNPGPIENNIYVPTHGGIGAITTSQVGGDIDVKGLADLDFFKNRLYAGLAIPKQFLGDTDDATGFNGGTSLTLTSSRYAKTIKRIQAVMIQAITDAINLILLDRKLDRYINKFTIKMQSPTTQEEIDRRDNQNSHINMIQDIMNLVDSNIEDPVSKLKMLKALLSETISTEEVFDIIQENIDALELGMAEEAEDNDDGDFSIENSFSGGAPGRGRIEPDFDLGGTEDFDTESDMGETGEGEDMGAETSLPTPDELGAGDFSDLNNSEL